MNARYYNILIIVLLTSCLFGQPTPSISQDSDQKNNEKLSLDLRVKTLLNAIETQEKLFPETIELADGLFRKLYRNGQPIEAISLFRKLMEHPDLLDTRRINIQRRIGGVFSSQNLTDSARHYLKKAYSLSIKNDSFEYKRILTSRGMLESKSGNYSSALDYYLAFLRMPVEGEKNSHQFIGVCFRAAKLFKLLGNQENANKYFDMGIEAGRNSKSDVLLCTSLRLAGIFIMEEDPDLARKYLLEAESLMSDNYPRNEMVSIYANMAGCYLDLDSVAKAKLYLDLAEPHMDYLGTSSPKVNFLTKRARLYYKMGKLSLAKNELSKIPDQITASQEVRVNVLLKEMAIDEEDFETAYEALQREKQLEDSIYQIRNNQIIFNLEEKYESAKKEKEISALSQEKHLQYLELKQKNNWLKYLFIGLILSGLLSGWIWKLYRDKKRFSIEIAEKNSIIEQALKDKDYLLKEIHHRVKNNLQVISSLFSLQSTFIKNEDALMAINESRDRIKSMTLIHQNLYRKDNMRGIEVRNYFEQLTRSLFYSYKISNNRIELKMDIADISLDLDTVMPIGLILNELISNALKYAFPDDRSGTIHISLLEKNECLQLIVKDNGIGFNHKLVEEDSESFGMEMISAFLQKLEANITYSNNQGTQVDLVMKNYIKT